MFLLFPVNPLRQGWPTFFPQPPILFMSSSYLLHKQKTSKFHSETKLISKKKNQHWKKFSTFLLFLLKSSCSLKKKGQRWKKFSKFLLFLLKPSCFLKKKVIAGNQGAIHHRLATPDIARYKVVKHFSFEIFSPTAMCHH